MRASMSSRAITNELSMRVIHALSRTALRFCEIERATNSPNPMRLSKSLKRLVQDGVLVRDVKSFGPPAVVSYHLTPLGADLAKPATAMLAWLDNNKPAVEAARARSVKETAA